MADDLQSKAAEMMKKVLTVGVGTIFLTEESLRGMVGDFKLPKEMIGGILDSAAKTKNEFLQSLSKDVLSRITEKMDPMALLQEFLAKNEIDLHMKISFKPKSGAASSSSSGSSADVQSVAGKDAKGAAEATSKDED